ncbi:MAG: glycosyltransferase [Deltaproteobacteria bacterium]|jgi:GT2 family glycosyltransferase|nr:glycosyltransferase [Deltaproteobacteria bacterium]
MPDAPILNITMPVFNRLQSTQRVLLALRNQDRRRRERRVSFCVTVVDNGSDRDLRAKLVEFRKTGIIDHLFLLPGNLGISCAANLGWQMVETPVYMKLDNDMLPLRPDWPDTLFEIWAHGKPISTLGGAQSDEEFCAKPGGLETPLGRLGVCTGTLAGQAMFIPREVTAILGRWSEDYGLYGAEDGDYGVRMRAAGLPQYYYLGREFFQDTGREDIAATYTARNLDRARMFRELFVDGSGGTGLFRLNNYLFAMCIRNWNVPLRYRVADVSKDYRVKVVEREEYEPVRAALAESKARVDAKLATGRGEEVYLPEFLDGLRELWRACGQGCEQYLEARPGLREQGEPLERPI